MRWPVFFAFNKKASVGGARKHYRVLYRKQIIWLTFAYLVPFVLFFTYFQIQYASLLKERTLTHLKSIAENQAKTLDLFLRERVGNLVNLIDGPYIKAPPSPENMRELLMGLKRDSETFIDIGFFSPEGLQSVYAGPEPSLEKKDYGGERWYRDLKSQEKRFIITDIYSGFRNKPHFTIGVKKQDGKGLSILRATLDPKKIYEYMTSLEGSEDVYISAVNRAGYYQLAPPGAGEVLEYSSIIPPVNLFCGTGRFSSGDKETSYAYAWLQSAPWAVVIRQASGKASEQGITIHLLVAGLLVAAALFVFIIINSVRLARMQKEKETAQSQLEHAAKLASIGELAGGIAHEINNPLAIIASEAGLTKDLIQLKGGGGTECSEIPRHLDNITEAAYRCRDITNKLLSFVRKDELNLKEHDIHFLIDEVLSGFLEREMTVSDVRIKRDYGNMPGVIIDANQFKQVLLNIINNAVDAITPPGAISIATGNDGKNALITVTDTGHGIPGDRLDKIFMPFYTTKEVGKGTGLGLSVSYAIIKNMGGRIMVESVEGKGSSFTISLPLIT
ncbi:ATP-binding protein [Fibrobacterota bacterium]